ncbi:MAG TPA: DUF3108 domain-containing protein [Pyrinomonadaceae bacterium]
MKSRFFTRLIPVALLLLVGIQGVAFAQQKQTPELPFARGEQLLYKAEINRGLLRGIDVGELRFSAQLASNDNVSMVGDAVSKGFLLRLTGNHFHIHVESVADALPFSVLRTKSTYKDKRTTINSEATFDTGAGKAVWTESERDQKPNATTLAINSPVHDVLTLIYFVRTQNLKPGQTFEVMMVDAGRSYRCVVNVVAGKKMSTAVGRVNTVRVEPAIFDGNREVRPRGTLAIWMTDDARHIPVKAQVKAQIGNVDINLKRLTYRDAALARK